MKHIKFLWILVIFVFSSCKSQVELISAVKERVIPGIPTQRPSQRYVISFEIFSDLKITFDEEKIEKENFEGKDIKIGIMTNNRSKAISAITKKGKYELIIESLDATADIDKEKLHLYYQLNGSSENFEIHNFETKEVRLR